MTHQPFPFYQRSNNASGSSFNVKRKLGSDDSDEELQQPMRIRSPPLKRRATFPVPAPVPDLMTDYSNSASDEDMGMDQDMDGDHGMDSPVITSAGLEGDGRGFVPHYDYEYGMSGSGGIGFGPGAEEDGEMMEETMSQSKPYPSLTPHTNPNHFSNIPPYTSNTQLGLPSGNAGRSSSPLSAQPFATSLRAPSPVRGLMQPSVAGPLPVNASEIDKARAIHGANCRSIPKLQISPYPDPITGKQPMYSVCPDCGTCERAA